MWLPARTGAGPIAFLAAFTRFFPPARFGITGALSGALPLPWFCPFPGTAFFTGVVTRLPVDFLGGGGPVFVAAGFASTACEKQRALGQRTAATTFALFPFYEQTKDAGGELHVVNIFGTSTNLDEERRRARPPACCDCA